MKNTVCTVIVTFNRKGYLLECLKSLLAQTRLPEAILVVDNASIDGTPVELKKQGYIKETPPANLNKIWETNNHIVTSSGKKIIFYYLRLPENTGGAGGFYEGIKKAYEKGYDWIWTMDDDAKPKEDALSLLLSAAEIKTNAIFGCNLVSPHYKDSYSRIHNSQEGTKTEKVNTLSFVGMFINSNIIAKIGFPFPDFFILSDDIEYCYRARCFGINLFEVKSSIIFAKGIEDIKEIKIFFLKIQFRVYNGLKLYYSIRNNFAILLSYRKFLGWSVFMRKFIGFCLVKFINLFFKRKDLFRTIHEFYFVLKEGHKLSRKIKYNLRELTYRINSKEYWRELRAKKE